MKQLTVKDIKPVELDGLSQNQIDQHWALYEKYVEQVNYLLEMEAGLKADKNTIIKALRTNLVKQIAFERNGLILHELYFSNLKAGVEFDHEGQFSELMLKSFGSLDAFLDDFRLVSTARGENWIMTVYDVDAEVLRNTVIDLHDYHVMYNCVPILVMDAWTHSWAVDYDLGEKSEYVEAFIRNIDWNVVDDRASKVK